MPDKQVVIVNRLSQKLSVTVNSGTGNREIDPHREDAAFQWTKVA